MAPANSPAGRREGATQRGSIADAGLRLAVHVLRRVDRRRAGNILAAILRRVGPWLREHQTGRANLAAAFPEKSAAERDQVLAGVWDNLGRFVAEFAQLDRIRFGIGAAGSADVDYAPDVIERLAELRRNG